MSGAPARAAIPTTIEIEPLAITVTAMRQGSALGGSVGGDGLGVGARLRSPVGSVAGRILAFTTSQGAPICSATTDATGRAYCTRTESLATFPATGYRAAFAGDDEYAPSSSGNSQYLRPDVTFVSDAAECELAPTFAGMGCVVH